MNLNKKVGCENYTDVYIRGKKRVNGKCIHCCYKGFMQRHGTYRRFVVCWRGRVILYELDILRVICPICRHTYSILPKEALPFRTYGKTFYWKALCLLTRNGLKVTQVARVLFCSISLLYSNLKSLNFINNLNITPIKDIHNYFYLKHKIKSTKFMVNHT